ncbi:MAG: cellulase family glycosylhydrolase [Calditrichia bacterium]
MKQIISLSRILLIISIWLFATTGALLAQGTGFFKAEGQKIVDGQGNEVLLRGMGLGGWLVPEGYMLNIPGFGSPSSIEAQIVDLIGQQDADEFYRRYEANYVNRNDIEALAQWGFNHVRLPFHYKTIYDPVTEQYKEEGFAIFDSLITWCDDNNLDVILDMHCAPGGQSKDNIADGDGILARLWTDPANKALTVKIWKEIATRYVNETRIIGYDLINEPVLPPGITNAALRDLYIQITDSIRSVDTNHIIIVEGNFYATNFDLLFPPWDDNMVYSFHKYWSATTVNTIQYLLDLRSAYDVPLWMGESGENSNGWFYEAIHMFEVNNIGWCWWTNKKIGTITSPMSATPPAGYQTVRDFWAGTAGRPSQSFARDALYGMAESLKLENCTPLPGLLRAMFDPDFPFVTLPFENHQIPGTIEAAHYDFGHQGLAFFDIDYKNTGNGSWNNGWSYRNDGVDIEPSQDTQGYAYNVGWIETGERLSYTVNVQTSGIYLVGFRMASDPGGGKLRILVDGQFQPQELSIPATGGWQNWQTFEMNNLELQAGTREITLFVTSGGFNFNQMSFLLVATGIDDEGNIVDDFQLDQNYPNPFNPTTTISYTLPKAADVQLKIVDTQGRVIRELVSEKKTSGKQNVEWNGRDDNGRPVSSGVYYYSIEARDGQFSLFNQTKKLILLK